jgi:methenyltetrahydrofolate cyclohydrolase
MTVEEFLRELASDSPAPGGGSAAALAGAAAGALCAMVARLTLGREKFRDAWPAMEDLRGQSQRLSARLAELVDEDTQAYAAVVAARRMPKNTGQEQAARTAAIAEATLRAARVPLETLMLLRELAACAARALERGNPSCLTDAGSAAALVKAGATAAAYNVRVNLPGVEDPAEREALRRQALEARAAVQETVRGVEQDVDRRLG